MCGRYVFKMTWSELRTVMLLATDDPQGSIEFPVSFNICPTHNAPIARRASDGDIKIELATWGLMPHWADKPGPINARAESLAEKPMFRGPLQKRRCVVPADGFYEWQAIPGEKPKRPHYIYRADGRPLLFAGLYEFREDTGPTYTIITTPANEFIAPLHDRMPAMLEPESFQRWLAEPDTSLLKPAPDGILTAHRVGTLVNSPKHNNPNLIAPAPADTLFG